MRSAIALIWLSLFWTLLCFLFYRDREVIIQASLPVWIGAALAWIVYRAVTAAVPPGWWRPRAKPPRKRAASKSASRAGGARRTGRTSAAKPRKRSS